MNRVNKVSVIIPIYNSEKYLVECFDSILNQSYKNLEIILVNDGSIDNSLAISKSYVEKDNRFFLYNNENHGVSYSRNFGLDKSTGDYIIFVDSDDTIERDFILDLVEEQNKSNVDVVACGFKLQYANKMIENKLISGVYDSDEIIKNLFYNYNSIEGYSVNKLFHKDIIEKNNLRFDDSIKIWEDKLFVVQYLRCTKRVAIIESTGYLYRMRKSSALNTITKKDLTVFTAYNMLCDIDPLYKKYMENTYVYLFYKYKKVIEKEHYETKKLKLSDVLFNKRITKQNKLYCLYSVFVPEKIKSILKKIKKNKDFYFE